MISINKQIIPKDKFIVGVSGGVDSISCLHLLNRIYKNKVIALHINHNVQDCNSSMEDSVSEFCDVFNIPLIVKKREASKLKGNIEKTLRDFRLSVFSEMQHDIVLCHHLNDMVESYIMNMLKGVPEYFPIPQITNLKHNRLIRPFLKNKKVNLESYAMNNGLSSFIVEDPSNKDDKFRRNHIRNNVIPLLQTYGLEKVVMKKFF